jgi:hypothetical protein
MEQISAVRGDIALGVEDIEYELKSAASSDTEQTHNLLSKTLEEAPNAVRKGEHTLISE